MADPSQSLGILTGDPEAAYASMGLITPQILDMQRRMQLQQAMEGALASGNSRAAIGMFAGRGLGDLANSVAQKYAGINLDPRMVNAQRNQDLLTQASLYANQQPQPEAPTAGAPSSTSASPSSAPTTSAAPGAMDANVQAASDALDRQIKMYSFLAQRGVPGAANQAAAMIAKKQQLLSSMYDVQEKQAMGAKDLAQANEATANANSKTIQIPIDQNGNYKTLQYNPETKKYDIVLGTGKKTPQTSITVLSQQDKVPLYAAVAKEMGTMHTQALTTQQNIRNLDAASTQLNAGIIAGTASQWRKNLQNLMATMGFDKGDELARTQAFIANTNRLAIGMGKGMFTRVTNWEAQLLRSISGGDVKDAAPALRAILGALRTTMTQQLGQYNSRRDELSKDKNIGSTIDALYPKIDIPEATEGAAGLGIGQSQTLGGFTVTRVK